MRKEARAGLPLSLTSLLGTLELHGPLTPSDLAAREQLAKPGISRALGRLREEGLVAVETIAEDARSYRVSITPSGRQLLADARERTTEFLVRALDDLDDRDVATLAAAAALLEELLDDRRG
jgi:DNA-binding MarR family transcriptional regulator